MHNFTANYEKILKVLKQISKEKLLPYQRRKPVLADIEVVAINLTAEYQLNLFENRRIKLDTPMSRNQKNYREQPYSYRKSRKRIETLFSQLCDQFMIRRNYAKSFEGFKTRILSKISALTIVQFINKVVFNRNINNIKISIV